MGSAVASNATSTLIIYYCEPLVYFNQAKIVQAFVASVMAAFSLLYIAWSSFDQNLKSNCYLIFLKNFNDEFKTMIRLLHFISK